MNIEYQEEAEFENPRNTEEEVEDEVKDGDDWNTEEESMNEAMEVDWVSDVARSEK